MGTTKERAEIELVINNKVAKNSLKELRIDLIDQSRILDKMKKEDDPAGWLEQAKHVSILRQSLKQANDEINATTGSFINFANESAQISVGWKDIMAGFLGGSVVENVFDLVKNGIVSTITRAGELSDSLADVSKATGMTKDEVVELNNNLQNLNTRTPVEELRKLAEMGGKFGVDKSEIEDFVKSADMLNVAFGDQFDSVEQLADETLKLRNIFQDIKSDDIGTDILHIGNAMNILEGQGAATGKGLTDFASRIGGVAIPLGFTTADVLGLSAALEELNVTPERGSTAVTTILQKMLTDTTAFAKVAKMEVKDFEKLLNTDLMAAFMAFAKGAKEGGKTGTEFAKILADTELTGSGASEVLLKIAANQDLVANKVRVVGEAIQKTTSITAEFNVKNENAASVLEKIGRFLTNTWDRIAATAMRGIEAWGRMTGMISASSDAISKYSSQQEKVNNLENQMVPLINRYEQLKKQTTLTKDEQAEMKKILDKVAEVLPNSVTKFDAYGNAIEFSTGKAREAIEVQKQLLKILNKDAISEVDKEIAMAERALVSGRKFLKSKGGTVEFQLGKGQVTIPRSEEVTAAAIKRYQEQVKTLEGLREKRKELLGDFNFESKSKPGPAVTVETEAEKKIRLEREKADALGLNNDKGELRKKALTAQQQLNEELFRNQQQLTLNMMKEQEKELQVAQNKYDELRKKAKGNATALTEINKQQAQEISQISTRYNNNYLDGFDKTIRAQLGILNNQKKEELAYNQQRLDDEAKRRDKELFEINNHYEQEIAIAKSKGESIVSLEKLWRDEVDQLNAGRAKKKTDDFLFEIFDSYRSELALAEENGTSKEEIVRSHLERLRQLREEYGNLDIEQQKKVNVEIARSDREMLAIKLDNINKTGESMKLGGQVISDVLSLTASNQNEYAEFQKALGLFQIAVDTSTAVASAVALGVKGDPYTVALRIITAVAAVTSGMLKAKQLMNDANQPSTPAFREHGGFTDLGSIRNDTSGNPEGWVSRPTLFNLGPRSFVAGEGYKKEYVLSNAMLKDPAIADFVGGVEALRQQRFFEHGGSTAIAPTRGGAVQGNSMARVEKLLEALLHKEGNWNYSILEKYTDDLEDVRSRASA